MAIVLSSSSSSGAQIQTEGAAAMLAQHPNALTLGSPALETQIQQQPTGITPGTTVNVPGAPLSVRGAPQLVPAGDAVKLSTGEYVSKTEFDKLSAADQALLMQLGIEKFNAQKQTDLQNFLNSNVKLSTGEYISKDAFSKLSPSDQQLLMSLGIAKFNEQKQADYQNFASQNTQLPNGQWIPNYFYNDLTPAALAILRSGGTDAFNQWLVGKKPVDVFNDGGWQPEFHNGIMTNRDSMPFWYLSWEAANFIPTPSNPTPPSAGIVGGGSGAPPSTVTTVGVSNIPGSGVTPFQPDFTKPNPFEGAPLSYYQQEIAGYIPTAANPLPPSLTYLQANPTAQLVQAPASVTAQPFTQSEFTVYQMATPQQKFNMLVDKGYIPKGSEFSGVDAKGEVLFFSPDAVLKNQVVKLWEDRVEALRKLDEQQLKEFESKLKGAPKDLQDAYAQGGMPAYLKVLDAYQAKTQAEYQTWQNATNRLAPYKDAQSGKYDLVRYIQGHPNFDTSKPDSPEYKLLTDAGFQTSEIAMANFYARGGGRYSMGPVGADVKGQNWFTQRQIQLDAWAEQLKADQMATHDIKRDPNIQRALDGAAGVLGAGLTMFPSVFLLTGRVLTNDVSIKDAAVGMGKGVVQAGQVLITPGSGSYDIAQATFNLGMMADMATGAIKKIVTYVAPRGIPPELMMKEYISGRSPTMTELQALGISKELATRSWTEAVKKGVESETGIWESVPIEGTKYEWRVFKTPLQNQIGNIVFSGTNEGLDSFKVIKETTRAPVDAVKATIDPVKVREVKGVLSGDSFDAKGGLIKLAEPYENTEVGGLVRRRVSAVVTDNAGNILLVTDRMEPKGYYGLPGGDMLAEKLAPGSTEAGIRYPVEGYAEMQVSSETGIGFKEGTAERLPSYMGQVNQHSLQGSYVVKAVADGNKIDLGKYLSDTLEDIRKSGRDLTPEELKEFQRGPELQDAVWWDGKSEISVSPATYDVIVKLVQDGKLTADVTKLKISEQTPAPLLTARDNAYYRPGDLSVGGVKVVYKPIEATDTIAANAKGIYTDPWAAFSYTRGGKGQPGFLMIITSPDKVKQAFDSGLKNLPETTPSFIRSAKEGLYGSSKAYKDQLETEIVEAPGTQNVVPPPKSDLATRVLTGKEADFFTYDNGQYIPVKVAIDKGVLNEGYHIPTPAELYVIKSYALETTLENIRAAIQHPELALSDIWSRGSAFVRNLDKLATMERGGATTPIGVRDIYLHNITVGERLKILGRNIRDDVMRDTDKIGKADDPVSAAREALDDAYARQVNTSLRDYADVVQAYNTNPAIRQKFEEAYLLNLADSMQVEAQLSNEEARSLDSVYRDIASRTAAVEPPVETRSQTLRSPEVVPLERIAPARGISERPVEPTRPERPIEPPRPREPIPPISPIEPRPTEPRGVEPPRATEPRVGEPPRGVEETRPPFARVPFISTEAPRTPPPPQSHNPVEWQKSGVPRGTIEWRQGKKWGALPPRQDGTYNSEDIMWLDHPLPGTYKFATGKGSAYKTLQVINGTGAEDADVDMGWAQVHIRSKGKDLEMTFAGGEQAATDRWAMEEAAMQEYERQAYANRPQAPISERIPRMRQQLPPPVYGLNKQEIPEFSTDQVKVYAVNGAYIRNRYANQSIGDRKGVDFMGAGHSGVYWKIIPPNEIWVEDTLKGEDRDAFILHELEERDMMVNKGKDYSEAHNDYANKVEIQARENPVEMEDMLAKAIEKYHKEHAEPRKRASATPKTVNSGGIRNRFYLGRKLPESSVGGV